MKTQIGVNLRQARENKGYTQGEVADRLGVSRTLITHYESGHTPLDCETLQRLADILEVSIPNLLGLETKTLADLSPPILEVVKLMQRLPKDRQDDILDFAQYIAGKNEKGPTQ